MATPTKRGARRKKRPDRAPIEPLLLTVQEACDALRISRTSLYYLVKDGRLRGVRLCTVGQNFARLYFRPEDLRAFVERQARAS